jgi:hypothetical protein
MVKYICHEHYSDRIQEYLLTVLLLDWFRFLCHFLSCLLFLRLGITILFVHILHTKGVTFNNLSKINAVGLVAITSD